MVNITIAQTNRNDYVIWQTLRIDNNLTKQVDRCTFTIRATDGYAPVVGNEVIVMDDITRVFGGVIVRRTQASNVEGLIEYQVECSDYTRILDQRLIAETYENMTVNDIIDDLVANWLPAGFTTLNVDCTQTVDYIQFKYETASACLEQLANLVGYDWYISYDMDIYFKSPQSSDAPVDIEDDTGVYAKGSLVIRKDNSQMRNSIYVRGGEYVGSEFTAELVADGSQSIFNLPYKFQDFEATLTGYHLSLGIDYKDDPNNYDGLYNFQEKLVRLKEADKPSVGSVLRYSGKPYLPVVVRYRDQSLISATRTAEGGVGDGIYEYIVIDKSINTLVAARQRAQAEITTYGSTVSEGEFLTETAGFHAGQRVLINSVSQNVNEYFIVNKVTSTMKSPELMKYEISLITTKTMDFIGIMKKLLQAENKKIVITDEELLDLSDSESESILFTAQTTVQAVNYAVQFVLGPYTPSGTKRVFIIQGSKLKA